MKNLFALIIAVGILLGGCTGDPQPKNIILEAEDIVWNPPLIEAEVGQEITLSINNTGALDHNFVSKQMGFDILVSPGETQSLTFVVNEPGSIEFICDIPGHEEAGMVGEIVVD
jgi:plastocyanin